MSARRAWLLLGLISSACVSLPHPTALDAERASRQWPQTTVETLEADRRLYAARCSGCHALHLPSRFDAEQWGRHLDDMAREAKLTPPERVRIERFVLTLARRPAPVTTHAAR